MVSTEFPANIFRDRVHTVYVFSRIPHTFLRKITGHDMYIVDKTKNHIMYGHEGRMFPDGEYIVMLVESGNRWLALPESFPTMDQAINAIGRLNGRPPAPLKWTGGPR